MASTSYNAVQVLDLLDAASRAIGGPVSGLVDQTPSTLILKMGSQEDDRGKLVFLLSFS